MVSVADDGWIDPTWFRQVLGQYPTGVCGVTSIAVDGSPIGMTVGSFTSVSLDPPLVAFFPDAKSSTWPKILEAGAFCVNVLAAEQESVCRAFASTAAERFAGINWRPTPLGMPILDGAIAWIDCTIDAVHEAGDHFIVVGAVRGLDISAPDLPLLFYQGGYGRFVHESLVTADRALLQHLHHLDLVRGELERLATELGVEATATSLVGGDVVVVAAAPRPGGAARPTRLGLRYPFIAPLGAVFAAWASDGVRRTWLRGAQAKIAREDELAYEAALDEVVGRRYSVILGDSFAALLASTATANERILRGDVRRVVAEIGAIANPPADAENQPIGVLTVPVFDDAGSVIFGLNLSAFGGSVLARDIGPYLSLLSASATRLTTAVAQTEAVD